MSASERLRELSALYDMDIVEAGDRYGPDVEYGTAVKRALPLIADLVEAAERVATLRGFDFGGSPDSESNPQLAARQTLAAALAALREHLQDAAGENPDAAGGNSGHPAPEHLEGGDE